jgi:hypothetical protein
MKYEVVEGEAGTVAARSKVLRAEADVHVSGIGVTCLWEAGRRQSRKSWESWERRPADSPTPMWLRAATLPAIHYS